MFAGLYTEGLLSEHSFRVSASGAVDNNGMLLESPSILGEAQAELSRCTRWLCDSTSYACRQTMSQLIAQNHNEPLAVPRDQILFRDKVSASPKAAKRSTFSA
jgi:hypothetical protein